MKHKERNTNINVSEEIEEVENVILGEEEPVEIIDMNLTAEDARCIADKEVKKHVEGQIKYVLSDIYKEASVGHYSSGPYVSLFEDTIQKLKELKYDIGMPDPDNGGVIISWRSHKNSTPELVYFRKGVRYVVNMGEKEDD